MAQRYFALGQVGQYTRYAILSGDHTVIGTQISRPDGVEVDRPAVLRWRNATAPEVTVKTWRINEAPVSHNGEQPRRPTWRRAGKRVNGSVM